MMSTNESKRKGLSLGRLLKRKRQGQPVDDDKGKIFPDEGERRPSFLVDDTASLDRKRRLMEQEGHRQLAKVHAREHNEQENTQQPAPEGELQNSIEQHPFLDTQRFDGVDTNLNPEPPLNSDARTKYDNEKREQDKEKQLRLGNMPKFSHTIKPSPL